MERLRFSYNDIIQMNSDQLYLFLEDLWTTLDNIQDHSLIQGRDDLMWEIEEAMGAIDNAIGIVEGLE